MLLCFFHFLHLLFLRLFHDCFSVNDIVCFFFKRKCEERAPLADINGLPHCLNKKDFIFRQEAKAPILFCSTIYVDENIIQDIHSNVTNNETAENH